MLKKTRLSYAIAIAVGATTTMIAPVHAAMLEEVIVTATKRAESAQDIPITIQALGEETLENLGIENFKDYIRAMPGVTAGGRGPGRNEVFIRGVSAGKGGLKVAGAAGSEPNVAFYLDETPISMGGRNIDPYMTDMNRVEVLPGPQGTLFGASSQAGTVRLITNKPEFNEFSAGFDASTSFTTGGDPSNSVEAHVNIPLIDDTLAVRLAIFNASEGGYIDNVRSSKQISLNNPALAGAGATPIRETVRNDAFVEDNFNDADYSGIRAGIKFSPNEDWDILLQHMQQSIETEGVWDYDPSLGELKSQSFTPDHGDDDFDLTSLTVTGRLGGLEMVYAGSFLDRTVEAISDYSGYSDNGPYMPYYICAPGYATCGTPDLFLDQYYNVERTTHEFRLSTDIDKPLRGIIGIFADDTETIERGNWNYVASIANGFVPNAPVAGSTASDPSVRNPGVTFFNDFTRNKEEMSFFGEVAYDVTDSVTASVGARRYDIELALAGSSNYGSRSVTTTSGNNVDARLLGRSPADFQDTIWKFNVQWNVNDEIMLYSTWSEGYRPGGFNRNGGQGASATSAGIPFFYESDDVTNLEFGWKTELMDGNLRFNGSVYQIDWEGMQVITLDFDISNTAFINNTADAEIQGIEIDSIWAATDNFTLFANVSYNETEMTRVPPNIVSINAEGTPLALAPELQYVFRGRYEWSLDNNAGAFAQLSYHYTDETISSVLADASYKQDSYTTVSATLGYSRDDWSITLFGENLTDELADLFISGEDNILKTTPNRPRTIGLRFSYDI